MSDGLDGYRSSEDEDYVPDLTVVSEDDNEPECDDDGFPIVTKNRGKQERGVKRKRSAPSAAAAAPSVVSQPARLTFTAKDATKKRGAKPRIGAAVLSSDEDDDQQSEPAPVREQVDKQSKTASDERHDRLQTSINTKVITSAATPLIARSSSNGDTETVNNVASAVQSAPAPTSPPSVASLIGNPSASISCDSSAASCTSSADLQPPPFTAAAKPKTESLTELVATFNTNPVKPAPKRVVNAWEIPAKPSARLPKPESKPPPSAEHITVTDFASYAGEAISVTTTLVKGSAEELARRRRADPLESIVASLTGKRSMNTLDKSRADWSVSKAVEGDEAELSRHVTSDSSYVAQQNFLQATDQALFERQREARTIARAITDKPMRRDE